MHRSPAEVSVRLGSQQGDFRSKHVDIPIGSEADDENFMHGARKANVVNSKMRTVKDRGKDRKIRVHGRASPDNRDERGPEE